MKSTIYTDLKQHLQFFDNKADMLIILYATVFKTNCSEISTLFHTFYKFVHKMKIIARFFKRLFRAISSSFL